MYLQKTVQDTATRGLFLIATPIGNMGDITLRAIEVLKSVDYILAEDTRTSQKLLQYLGMKQRLVSFHEHNQYEKTKTVIADIAAGKSVGLISDAGMPCISDPGALLVQAMVRDALPVTVIPGASAGVSLFSLSGFSDEGSFVFHGFLPTKEKAKADVFTRYKALALPIIFYESPHRILKTLTLLAQMYPSSTSIVLGRELTKLHETIVWFTLGEFAEADFAELMTWKGEISFIVFNRGTPHEQVSDTQLLALIEAEIAAGRKPKEAMKQVGVQTGMKPNALYDLWQREKK
jgi:16S rRNA (cytidine1402-2'-O)-methyltransferase